MYYVTLPLEIRLGYKYDGNLVSESEQQVAQCFYPRSSRTPDKCFIAEKPFIHTHVFYLYPTKRNITQREPNSLSTLVAYIIISITGILLWLHWRLPNTPSHRSIQTQDNTQKHIKANNISIISVGIKDAVLPVRFSVCSGCLLISPTLPQLMFLFTRTALEGGTFLKQHPRDDV